VIAFPQARRMDLVEKTAAPVARAQSQEQADRLLAATVRKQRRAMARKRIPADRIERECRGLETSGTWSSPLPAMTQHDVRANPGRAADCA
jgi:hypothetical protein